jgi:hypothetical protein
VLRVVYRIIQKWVFSHAEIFAPNNSFEPMMKTTLSAGEFLNLCFALGPLPLHATQTSGGTMKLFLVTAATLTCFALPAQAEHSCTADAKLKAEALLKLHMAGLWKIDATNIGTKVVELAPVAALKGNANLDVLELEGKVNKATYRLRMIYAGAPKACALIGQEVIEVVDVK